MRVKTVERSNVHALVEYPNVGWEVVDEYYPCPTTCPWDYYGLCHQRQYGKVLKAAGIDFEALRTVETRIHPTGSGPNGRVRFGDDMMPGIYRIAVRIEDADRAHRAINALTLKSMPEACQ